MAPFLATPEQAVEELKKERLIGLPTETVYGLAGRIDSPKSIAQIFSMKERPFFDPLIVHVHSIQQAILLVKNWPIEAQILAEKFWPGPLTLVLPKNRLVSDTITSGLLSVGLRCPDHPLALQILRRIDVPLAAPSANKFGRTSPTMASHVMSEFANEDLAVVDGGPCDFGIESTVVLVESGQFSILRSGSITSAEISMAFENKSHKVEQRFQVSNAESPGHMKHHYMPSKPFILCLNPEFTDTQIAKFYLDQVTTLPSQIEGVQIIKLSDEKLNGPLKITEFNLPKEARDAARMLYSELRLAGQKDGDLIVLRHHFDLNSDPSWAAVEERLVKAAILILPPKKAKS